MKKLLILAALMCCLTAQAASKKDKKKETKAPAEKVDTIPAKDFSYLFGKVHSNGLMGYLVQRMGVDTTYMDSFMEGFDNPTLTDEDKKLKARLSGKEIREQVASQILPQAAKQVNDSTEILSPEQFVAGFRAAVSGQNDAMPISMDSAQQVVMKQLEYYRKERMERKYGSNRIAGEEFLKQNAKAKDVVTTESGLQYKILQKGEGEIPTKTQRVKVNYEGRLLDGTVFDSSAKHKDPSVFSPGQVIKGWGEALTMMPVGSKWELYIPQELAYGDRETGNIPPYSMLIFTVEILSIEK